MSLSTSTRWYAWWCAIFFVFGVVRVADGELTISGPRCGVLTCQTSEFCSPFETQCKSCADICEMDSHNFEEKMCVDKCQDYLHDARYVRVGSKPGSRGNGPSDGDRGKDDIKTVKTLAVTALILVLLLIALHGGYLVYNWVGKDDLKNNVLKYFRRDTEPEDIEKGGGAHANGGNDGGGNHSNASTATPKRDPRSDLRLNINATSHHNSAHSEPTSLQTPATMTTSISRRPAEDSALDYAYDNHAMSGTPSPHSALASPSITS